MPGVAVRGAAARASLLPVTRLVTREGLGRGAAWPRGRPRQQEETLQGPSGAHSGFRQKKAQADQRDVRPRYSRARRKSRPGSPATGLRRWGGRPGVAQRGRRGFVGQVEGRRSRDQPIARADVVEKSAFLRSGVGCFAKSSRIKRNDGIFGAVNPPNVRSSGAARPGNVRLLGCDSLRQIP